MLSIRPGIDNPVYEKNSTKIKIQLIHKNFLFVKKCSAFITLNSVINRVIKIY